MLWRILSGWVVLSLFVLPGNRAFPQSAQDSKQQTPPAVPSEKPAPPSKVEVQPAARDDQIGERLRDILLATDWFNDPDVSVKEGVVFLQGQAKKDHFKQWAGDLARKTEGVVAVVNQMQVATPNFWDFSEAWEESKSLGRDFIGALPLLLLALLVLLLAWGVARLTAQALRASLRRRVTSALLREVAARGFGILVFLLGLYLVLRVSGLTRLAVTVIGGTGLIGLVLGIAFRDITENFLASLFLSLQHPFREGDLVEIGGSTGYVQRLTSRTTVLMALDGNQVQIPNATVFKSTIRNYTSSPNRREDFTVGIGYDDAIPQAQEVAQRVLAEHPAVLKDPKPWVLVDNLGASTVNLRVYFWLDGTQHSWLKVRSSVIRLVKRAFQNAGISLPDEAREILFPDGVPVRMLNEKETFSAGENRRKRDPTNAKSESVSSEAEGGLRTEAGEIEEQARRAWSPDHGENLLATETRTDGPKAKHPRH
jgi:small-conductance mechanosensitive channel